MKISSKIAIFWCTLVHEIEWPYRYTTGVKEAIVFLPVFNKYFHGTKAIRVVNGKLSSVLLQLPGLSHILYSMIEVSFNCTGCGSNTQPNLPPPPKIIGRLGHCEVICARYVKMNSWRRVFVKKRNIAASVPTGEMHSSITSWRRVCPSLINCYITCVIQLPIYTGRRGFHIIYLS